MNKPTATG